ncbi:MAG: hypothetical protein WCO06_02965 [Candidatus Roizmanbacteria bacterium]
MAERNALLYPMQEALLNPLVARLSGILGSPIRAIQAVEFGAIDETIMQMRSGGGRRYQIH